ncbi:MAG: serine/threonine protein kinase [Planctomycetaceae bacterium]|nr:serine/threonine protein kinase [Planctomycetaceae bacterium]
MSKSKWPFDDWKNVTQIAEGGQAITYKVQRGDGSDNRAYVLKRLKNLSRVKRFQHEVKACLQLRHQNLIQIIADGLNHPKPYFVMEFCEGGTLADQDLTDHTVLQRLRIFSEICRGVAHAHEKGIIHRDIKPENILLRADGTIVVSDCGLCHFEDHNERATHINEVVGPRWYTAPELEAGRVAKVTPACDIYSLGKLLYWILAGRVFPRENGIDRDIQEYDLTGSGMRGDINVIYDDLFSRTIAYDARERFANAGDLLQGVEDVSRQIKAAEWRESLAGLEWFPSWKELIGILRRSSIPTWHRIELSREGLTPRSTVFNRYRYACLATSRRKSGEREHWFLTCRDLNSSRGSIGEHEVDWTTPSTWALTFDDNDCVLVSHTVANVGERAIRQGCEVHFESYNLKTHKMSTLGMVPGVGRATHSAIAVSRTGRIALYHPSEKGHEGNPGVHPETILFDNGRVYRHEVGVGETYPSPIRFDTNGRLHQALVMRDVKDQTNQSRELVYYRSDNGDDWNRARVYSPGASFAASVGLAVTTNDDPVIICNSAQSNQSLIVHTQTNDSAWSQTIVDVSPTLTKLHFRRASLLPVIEFVIGEDGVGHLLLLKDATESLQRHASSGLLYLRLLTKSWKVEESRWFPRARFLGMGVDEHGVAKIALLRET